MKTESKFTLAKAFLLNKPPKQICTCERDVVLTDFLMTEQDLCIRRCKHCVGENDSGWMTYYDSLKFGMKKKRSVRKHRMYNSFMRNARILYQSRCYRCGHKEGLWSYHDKWARQPYSIFANPIVFGVEKKMICGECAESLIHARPGNNKWKPSEDEVQVDYEKEILDELLNADDDSRMFKSTPMVINQEPKPVKLHYKKDAVVTSLDCLKCKSKKPVADFHYFRSDRDSDYCSRYCSTCRKEMYIKYNKTGNLSPEELDSAKYTHEKNLEKAICVYCGNKKEGEMKYYNINTHVPVKFFKKPWNIPSKVYTIHKECVRLKNREEKAKKLMQFEQTILDVNSPPKLKLPFDF